MYWKAIGTTVRAVYEHTYFYNRVFARPIFPLGQTYGGASPRSLKLFRRYALSYGGGAELVGLAGDQRRQWGSLGRPTAGRVLGYRPVTGTRPAARQPRRPRRLGPAASDRCRLEEPAGDRDLRAPDLPRGEEFQSKRGMRADGVLGRRTWRSLLRVTPVRIHWAKRRGRGARLTWASGSAASAPLSAALPARRNEIDPGPRP